MILDELLTKKFMDKIASYTTHNVNIMNEQGIIVAASKDTQRVGDFHEVAFQMLQKKQAGGSTSQEEAYLGVQPGVNLLLSCKGKTAGVVGVTGDPREVYDIAMIIKMSLETMLEYESQYERIQERRNSRLQFLNTLFYEDDPEMTSQLPSMAHSLGLDLNLYRLPVLFVFGTETSGDALEEWMELLRFSSGNHQDILFRTRSQDILLLKQVGENTPHVSRDYRTYFEQYYLDFQKKEDRKPLLPQVYVGTPIHHISHYPYELKHCTWMKQNISNTPGQIQYFQDHIQEYLSSQIPFLELHHIYQEIAQSVPDDLKKTILETVSSLEKSNYNLNAASKEQFIHKNTLIFRLNKIREYFQINPMQNREDQNFLYYLSYYLTNR